MATTTDPPRYQTPGSTPPAPSGGPRRRGLVIAVVVAVVLLALIIGGAVVLTQHGSKGSATGTTSSTTSATRTSGSTSPTSAPGTSGTIPAESPTPPSLAAAYTPDPVLVVKTLSTYIDWLFAHPDPALVANVMLNSNHDYSNLMGQMQLLVKNGWHGQPSMSDIVFAKANGPFQAAAATVSGHQAYIGTSVRVVVQYSRQSSDVLDASGHVVSSFNNPSQEFLVISLAQGPDGQFRFSDEEQLNPPSISEFES